MQKSVLKTALGLDPAVVEGAGIEGDSIMVSARPRRPAPRCPVCGRRCDGYDTQDRPTNRLESPGQSSHSIQPRQLTPRYVALTAAHLP